MFSKGNISVGGDFWTDFLSSDGWIFSNVTFQLEFTALSILLTDSNTYRSIPVWRKRFYINKITCLLYNALLFSTTRKQMLEQIPFVALMIFHILTSLLLGIALTMYGENKLITDFADIVSTNFSEKVIFELLRNDEKATEPHIQINKFIFFIFQETVRNCRSKASSGGNKAFQSIII